eukprot:9994619-Ditylum_brightwellii.AAC.1
MPDPPGHKVLIVVPTTLQMGWLQSEAFFCKATSMAKNIMDNLVQHNILLPPTPIEFFHPHRRNKTCIRSSKPQRHLRQQLHSGRAASKPRGPTEVGQSRNMGNSHHLPTHQTHRARQEKIANLTKEAG